MGCCGSKPQDDVLGEPRPQEPKAEQRRMRRTDSAALAVPKFDARTYECKYQGRVTASEPYEGDAQVAAAQKRVKKESSTKPQEVKLYVSGEHIRITSLVKDELLYDCLISEVRFVSLNPKDKKGIALITVDKHQVGFCHFFSMNSNPADDVRQAIGSAFRAAAEVAKRDQNGLSAEGSAYARRLSTVADSDVAEKAGNAAEAAKGAKQANSAPRNAVQAGKDASEVMGTFEMTYIGSSPVKDKNGHKVAEAAVETIATTLTKSNTTKVAVVISGDGLKAVDMMTSEPALAVNIHSLSSHIVITPNGNGPLVKRIGKKVKRTAAIVALFVNDDRLKRTTVQAFASNAVATCEKMCEALNKAFEVQLEIKKLRKKNPFAAISSKREASPKSLFALQLHRSDLAAVKVIGYGQFGEVYLAKQATKVRTKEGGTTTKVLQRAVKILRNSAGAADRADFLKEAESMIDLNHPNIVQLVGVAVQQRPWLTVLEFIEYGDLLAVSKTCKEKEFTVSQKEFYLWFVQISSAMEYIASKIMIRKSPVPILPLSPMSRCAESERECFLDMDLAARNVLLGEDNLCKIADFGLTRKLNPEKGYYRLMKTMKLPVKWMAIESMADKIFSVKTDVWAFGITMWEVLSYGGIPYGKVKNMDVCNLVSKGLRAVQPEGCSDAFYKFLLTLWEKDPKNRPVFARITQTLQTFLNDAPGHVRDVGKTLRSTEQPKAKTPPPETNGDKSAENTEQENEDSGQAADASDSDASSDSDEDVDGDDEPSTPTPTASSNPIQSNNASSDEDEDTDDKPQANSDAVETTAHTNNASFQATNPVAVNPIAVVTQKQDSDSGSEEDSDSDLDC